MLWNLRTLLQFYHFFIHIPNRLDKSVPENVPASDLNEIICGMLGLDGSFLLNLEKTKTKTQNISVYPDMHF